MRAKREFRNRDGTEVAVLDELVDRADDGMTVLEIRAAVETDIDGLEEALSRLKSDGLIDVEQDGQQTVIKPNDRVVPDDPVDEETDESLVERLRDRFGL
ncbi:DUF6432 family protein [Natronolimnobius baerhuensis]|uniref:MarR family transcriptional regulator n=1 Tax=Natronolimnobius baerhuensis TaxID=253108 RepID=A0A202E9M9_9EURY|nr:DUF6432 family protein [Natronolimnobius baerhuensis]OVE84929.1 MarR family transcriptional regulator [Natronolimnobius baerhuensis]